MLGLHEPGLALVNQLYVWWEHNINFLLVDVTYFCCILQTKCRIIINLISFFFLIMASREIIT